MLTQLEAFTHGLLAHQGALVEREESGLSAMIPASLAATLGISEYERLVFEPQADAAGGVRVDYDSPVIERLGEVVDRLGRAGWMAVAPPPLKGIDPAEVVERGLTVGNGIVRDCRAQPADALYVCFFVGYELLGDERVSGLLEQWVNVTMRSLPRFDGLLARATGISAGASGPVPADRADGLLPAIGRAWPLAAPEARRLTWQRLEPALDSLRRRRDRDLGRLRDYYIEIDGEIRRRVRRARAKHDEEGVRAEASRLAATAQAYRSRVADLVDRSRVRVRLTPLGAVACSLPVHDVIARFHRRLAAREVHLAWNPFDRTLERPCCEGCGSGLTMVSLCDDRVHLLCERCSAACEVCGRPFCRACHATCPRRHAG